MTSERIHRVALIAVAILALGGYFYPTIVQHGFGGVTNYDEVDATALKIGGTNGSRVGPIIAGQCSLTGMNTSQAASSSANYDCAVTGVVSGDTVFATLATTTPSASVLNWAITSAVASTTSGFISVRVSNFSGAAAVPSITQVGSTTQYLVFHPVTSVPGL